jgi:RNA polymerase sigma-70 factor (sigma-E family)
VLFPEVLAAIEAVEVDGDRAERIELLEEVFESHGRDLVRLARIFTDDRNAAEDLVQEAFIRLYRTAGRVQDRSKIPAYMRSIVLNLCRDHNRRGLMSLRHQQRGSDLDPDPEPDVLVVRSEDQSDVIDALLALSDRQRECLVLRYYLDLGEREIAATLGISPNSVKTHTRRGMDGLRERLAVPA